MKCLQLFSLTRPPSTLSTPSAFRVEVRPPSLRHAPVSLGQRLMFWLLAPAPHDAAPPITRLPKVKSDFLGCLEDVEQPQAESLRHAIRGSHSLRELWHLRVDVYSSVAQSHSEAEAEHRLQRLNRHFATRSPRPGLPALAHH